MSYSGKMLKLKNNGANFDKSVFNSIFAKMLPADLPRNRKWKSNEARTYDETGIIDIEHFSHTFQLLPRKWA
jgi:hypothetical protein